MSRYTPPKGDDEFDPSFRRRPLWIKVAVVLCLLGTLLLGVSNLVVVLLD